MKTCCRRARIMMLSWAKMSAEFRGTECYVAKDLNLKGRLCRLSAKTDRFLQGGDREPTFIGFIRSSKPVETALEFFESLDQRVRCAL